MGIFMLRLLKGRDKFRHRRQGAAPAWLRRDIETLHQTPLLLTVLLATRTYGQLFKASVYGTDKKIDQRAQAIY